ncbi:protein turtle-like isoform X2 [Neocloeon triangulifer]|uniref:protein turtle-like isoform X2 n=1 Tax=Neocloeon triangulifer TaxID=2078957 RepID=UPI00286F3BCE|nr:protein turtle-like isoform X2 [Neocloeon triangulifer]
MGMCVGPLVGYIREAVTCLLALTSVCNVFLLLFLATPGVKCFQDAVHITAILGESVVFNCHVEFPGDHPVPYVLQWEKKGLEIPIYIWYDSYPTHSGEGYEGRVSRVASDSPYGLASLNLTNIRESDQGWYECKVVFLNRSPNSHKNGTWFHLDVHAPPRFGITPEDIIYVNLGDSIILNCQAEGTPTPEILWYKDQNPVEPSATTGIFNDGTELRISNIRHEDIGDYTCIARNGEGQISHTARVIIAGGAVIMVPPTNQTKLEGEKAQFSCEAKALPGNVTVKWYREGVPVKEVSSLETRVTVRRDGSLIVNPVSADDSGQYTCEVTNGIGEPQAAAAYLNVEYPAKVTFTPTIQYLPFRLAGVVQCYIKANPPLQYVTWTKDKRLLEPYQTKDIVIMNNGSLLFTRVNENHQGRYTCTPYNAQGTQGSSGPMEVLVRKPPVFTLEPESLYQRKLGESVEMVCEAQEAEGTQKPVIQWSRRDGQTMQRNRIKMNGGNLTIENLRRTDFGFYQCVASNEVATIVTTTQLVVEGTQPHAPYNLTANASEFSVHLTWLPGYSGGPDFKQDYTIWYRETGASDWSTFPVTPSGSTEITIQRLTPSTDYQFQVVGKNSLGDGMFSQIISVQTKGVKIGTGKVNPQAPEYTQNTPSPDEDIYDYSNIVFPTDSDGGIFIPPVMRPKGPKPGPPRNVTVNEISNGFLINWQAPAERSHLVQYYTIKYKTDAQWKVLNKGQIRAEETSYLVKNLVGGRTYHICVVAHALKNYESSEPVKFPVPARVKHKAITAGVVGGILFFIVAIILSVCAVKICNKRKRRKQEKALSAAYNMVACRTTDQRNGGQAAGQVPLKKSSSRRIPAVTVGAVKRLGAFFLSGFRHTPEKLSPSPSPFGARSTDSEVELRAYYVRREMVYPLSSIARAADGRFVLDSASSSSDDGGFAGRREMLEHPPGWRRPIIVTPSLRSEASGESHTLPRHRLSISTRLPTMRASSPGPLTTGTWPIHNFSDLSSVRQPSSMFMPDVSLPTPSQMASSLRSMQERYRQELPSLQAIHAEVSPRWQHVRVDVHQPAPHRLSGRHVHTTPLFRPLQPSSPVPGQWALLPKPTRVRPANKRALRHARSAPELRTSPSRPSPLELSPESRSSSSGFGSKNNSQQTGSSSRSPLPGPPYRPPPPPPLTSWLRKPLPLYMLSTWPPPPYESPPPAPDSSGAGRDASVDDHYEFDADFNTPVPTPSPGGPRQSSESEMYNTFLSTTSISLTPSAKHQDIEARVQAMKQEFHEYRERQARRRHKSQQQELESAC